MVDESIALFLSYSHRDEELRSELETHLAILQRQHVIKTWHDRKIGVGTEWENHIDDNLRNADIILLLVSSYFLASKYCYDIELSLAMKRHGAGEALVVPVILRPVDWSGAPFSKLQALPKDAKPITTWGEQHAALMDVAQSIRELAQALLKERQQKWEQKEAARTQYKKKVEEILSSLFGAEISIIGRDTLDELREYFGLTPEEAKEIENNAFKPYREYKERLERYKKTLNHVIQHGYPLSERFRKELKDRQRDLGLKAEDIERIEHPIFAEAEDLQAEAAERLRQEVEAANLKQRERQPQETEPYDNKLRRYKQEFTKAVQGEFPLSEFARNGLQAFWKLLELRDEDIARIEQPILAQAEMDYQKNLKQEAAKKQRLREKVITLNATRTSSKESVDEIPRQAPGKPEDSSDLLERIQQLLDGFTDSDLYLRGAIPSDKLANATKAYAPGVSPKEVLLLYDNTAFGGAKDGLVLTEEAVYWHNIASPPGKISYTDIYNTYFRESSSFSTPAEIVINLAEINVSMREKNKVAATLTKVIRYLAKQAKR